ncbi:MAG: TolC family protein [Bacteroidales bacterium]|nr:TolC family protein [Bacteroidales bacterium]
MRKLFSVVSLLMLTLLVHGQQSLSLQQCYQLALKNHPLSGQNALYEKASQIQEEVYNITNLPAMNLNGQATYQSSVTELPIKIPGMTIPEIKQEQFKVSVDVNQVLYGGGLNDLQKKLEKDILEINKQGTEAELYKLKEKINQVFFGILLADNTLEILKLNNVELEARLKKLESGVKNGVILPYNASILKAEILKVEQKRIELTSQRKAFILMLGVLTGTEIPESSMFEEPQFTTDIWLYSNNRPEFKLFDLQQKRGETLKSISSAKRNPRLFAFTNLGYGRPGLNMFKEEAELYYIFGAKVSWNIWNWNQTQRERQILDINNELITNQKKAFDFGTRTAIQQYLADASKLEELLKTDESLITLRKEISAAAASQLENGIITATEYLTEYNSEVQAMLSQSLHHIQLLQTRAAYLATTGNL